MLESNLLRATQGLTEMDKIQSILSNSNDLLEKNKSSKTKLKKLKKKIRKLELEIYEMVDSHRKQLPQEEFDKDEIMQNIRKEVDEKSKFLLSRVP